MCCLCRCVMILVNLCHNGLSIMYDEVTHTRWPREPCNVLTLMVGTNEEDWTICFVGLIWWSSVDPKECLWDQTHFYWLGMCLTRRLHQGCESRALWILTSQFQSEPISGMMPVTDHFDERMVLQCMEYCNGFDTFQYLFDLIDLLQCWKRLLWSLRVWNASCSMKSGLSLVVPCVSHIGQSRLDAVCQKLMTTYACWMSAIWWVWFWWICGTNKMLNSRYFAYCCCLLLWTQNEPETLLLPTSAVAYHSVNAE